MQTPSQFNSGAKHMQSKSALIQQQIMTSGGTGISSAESHKL
jgi:hypothetical protein